MRRQCLKLMWIGDISQHVKQQQYVVCNGGQNNKELKQRFGPKVARVTKDLAKSDLLELVPELLMTEATAE
eukprot:132218-Ditylum_brightwellii.AAC.1